MDYEKPSNELDEKLRENGYYPAYSKNGHNNLYADNDGHIIWTNGSYYREANSWQWKKEEDLDK